MDRLVPGFPACRPSQSGSGQVPSDAVDFHEEQTLKTRKSNVSKMELADWCLFPCQTIRRCSFFWSSLNLDQRAW